MEGIITGKIAMRKAIFLYIFCLAYILTGCTTTASDSQTARPPLKKGHAYLSYQTAKHAAKRGNKIAFYSQESFIQHPYRIIGKETISRYNLIGFERQDKTLNELMKNLAAAMGGDAIVNITSDKQKIEGTVIAFEQVLL